MRVDHSRHATHVSRGADARGRGTCPGWDVRNCSTIESHLLAQRRMRCARGAQRAARSPSCTTRRASALFAPTRLSRFYAPLFKRLTLLHLWQRPDTRSTSASVCSSASAPPFGLLGVMPRSERRCPCEIPRGFFVVRAPIPRHFWLVSRWKLTRQGRRLPGH